MFAFKFPRSKASAGGLTALCAFPGRWDVARVSRPAGGGKPRVELLESYERGKQELEGLRHLRKKFALHKARCSTLLAPSEYQILQIETPAAAETAEERLELVRARVQDMIETPVAHVTLDVVDIPTEALAPGRPRNSYVMVAGNAGVAPKVQGFHAAGIGLRVIDVPELAQRNLAALSEQANRALAFLCFDEFGSLLTFTANGELYMFRRADIGLAQLLTEDMERRSALFDRIGLEVQRSLDNFDRQYGFLPLARLLLGPQPVAVPLQGYLKDYLGIPVDVLDLADVLDFEAIPELRDPGRQAQCLQTLGAALREEAA